MKTETLRYQIFGIVSGITFTILVYLVLTVLVY